MTLPRPVTEQRLRDVCAAMHVEIEIEAHRGQNADYLIGCTTPSGQRFVANYAHGLIVSRRCGRSGARDARRCMIEMLALGLVPCPTRDCDVCQRRASDVASLPAESAT